VDEPQTHLASRPDGRLLYEVTAALRTLDRREPLNPHSPAGYEFTLRSAMRGLEGKPVACFLGQTRRGLARFRNRFLPARVLVLS
jgi:hypothetical protein